MTRSGAVNALQSSATRKRSVDRGSTIWKSGDEMADSAFAEFEIALDRDYAVYRAGDTVGGHVVIRLSRPMTLHAVRIQFSGRAWVRDVSKKASDAERVYFDRNMVLLERPPGRDPGAFPWIADHRYMLPFECPLPTDCATSYEGDGAFVRYFCRVVVEEGEAATYVAKRVFTVLAPPPAALDAQLLRPVGASEQAVGGSCCCRSKSSADVSLAKAVFVPGEGVFGSVKVDNRQASEAIDALVCRLVDRIGADDRRVIVEQKMEKGQVAARSLLNRESVELLRVPSVAPSRLATVDALVHNGAAQQANGVAEPKQPNGGGELLPFQLEYALEVQCGPKLLVSVPISIGSVPLSQEDNAPAPTGFRQSAATAADIREQDDLKRVHWVGGHTFTPQYPVFENQQTATVHTIALTQ